MMGKRTMQYLALITMTWIMHVLTVVQAQYLEPPLNTFQPSWFGYVLINLIVKLVFEWYLDTRSEDMNWVMGYVNGF